MLNREFLPRVGVDREKGETYIFKLASQFFWIQKVRP